MAARASAGGPRGLPDDIREELTGDAACQARNGQVFALAKRRARAALAEGRDVVIDATNVTRDARREWARLAIEQGTPCLCVWIECTVARALRNNAARERRVPEDVIRTMAREFTPPCVDEGFDEVARARAGLTSGGCWVLSGGGRPRATPLGAAGYAIRRHRQPYRRRTGWRPELVRAGRRPCTSPLTSR